MKNFLNAIKATIVGTVLMLATLGSAYALTGDDVDAIRDMKASEIASYIESQGETVTTFTGEKARAFDQGMALFLGAAAPAGTVGFIYGDPDPEDSTILVIVYDENDTVLGGAWVPTEIVAAAVDYAENGV